jgi:hypothetical protein
MTEMNTDALRDVGDCRLAAAAELDLAGLVDSRARPVRRKRVAFALWFAALIGASAVIVLGAAPLVTP